MALKALLLRLIDRLLGRTYRSPNATNLYRRIYDLCDNDCFETRRRLYDELLRGTFVVPTFYTTERSNSRTTAFIGIELETGMSGIPIFISTGALRVWRPWSCDFALMPGQKLFLMAANVKAEIVAVNPGSSPTGILNSTEIQRLAEGMIPVVNAEGKMPGFLTGNITYGPLELPLPLNFLDSLRQLLPAYPDVRRAYAIQASINGAPPRAVIIVNCPYATSEQNPLEFMPKLVRVGNEFKLDIYYLVLEQHSAFASVPENITAFYERIAAV